MKKKLRRRRCKCDVVESQVCAKIDAATLRKRGASSAACKTISVSKLDQKSTERRFHCRRARDCANRQPSKKKRREAFTYFKYSNSKMTNRSALCRTVEIVCWDKLRLHYRSTDIWIATRWTFYHRFQAFQVYVLVKFTAWRMPKLFMWPGARTRSFKVFVIIDVNNACKGSQHLQLKKYFTPEIYVARAAITIATIATKLAANLDPNTANS